MGILNISLALRELQKEAVPLLRDRRAIDTERYFIHLIHNLTRIFD